MNYLEDCGLVKMDFLGLKTLTLIKNTLKLLKRRGIELDLHSLPEDDPATFKLLGEGKSTCIFQFESQGMQEVLKQAKPESIYDLIALTALYRPGPMEFINQFIDVKRGRKPIHYPLPELEPILKETYGVIVYQEQVMEIARRVGGFSLGGADIVRRVMGKKKPEAMPKLKIQFIDGAIKNGYTQAVAETIFDLLVPFAGYGFNKSHAAAYSLLAYQTAFLKANYPAEFMAANLTNEINSTDKLSEYIAETRGMGISILPPDINLSEKDFTVKEDRIIYGLKGIKNVGSAAVDEIMEQRRRGGAYEGYVQFLERVDLKVVNRKVVETLILCGVFDCFKVNRATLFHNLDKVLEVVSRVKETRKYGQATLFDGLETEGQPGVELKPVEEWPPLELLIHEKQNLGFYFSGHPLDKYRKIIRQHTTLDLSRLEQAAGDRLYTLTGILKEVKCIHTKTGRRMAFALLEDFNGSIELVIFSDVYERSKELLVEDSILTVSGKVDRNRGEPKLRVETVTKPSRFKAQAPRAVHVRFTGSIEDEDNLLRLRDFMVEKPGNCAVYFHLGETIIKASPQISLSPEDEVLETVRTYAQVEDVWKE
ncbi:DNA polymerase III subunit alpha [subsurface metagenome]